jgi:small conductance mechanosensitive channel
LLPWEVTALQVLLALAAAAAIGFILNYTVRRVAERAGASEELSTTISEAVVIIVTIIAVTSVAGVTGLSSQLTTLTVGGIAGLAISLAFSNSLSNVIAGVLMFYDGTLRVGDYIEYGGLNGQVVRVAFRSTWVRRDDGVIVVVSNGNLIGGPLANRTAQERLARKMKIQGPQK